MSGDYKIVLADDHALLRKGMRSILMQEPHFGVVGEAENGLELLDLLNRGTVPDVLLLDLSMPLLPGLEALRLIRQAGFDFKILVLTSHKEPELICQALSSGADGFVLKDEMAKELLPALHDVLTGRFCLSPAVAKELPPTCRMRTAAETGAAASSAKHCGGH